MEFSNQKSKKVIVTFALLGICLLQLSSCQKHKTAHHSKHKAVAVIKDTVGAQQVEENIPENTYVPDTSDTFRNGILRQLHIPVEEQIYYKAAEIPYLENRTAVIIIKSDDKTKNNLDHSIEKHLIIVETNSGTILSNRIIETQTDPGGDKSLFSLELNQYMLRFDIEFGFSQYNLKTNSTKAFSVRYIKASRMTNTNYYDECYELFEINNDSAFSILEPTTIASSIATGIPCENSSFQELKGQVLIGKKEVYGYKDIIFKFTINRSFTQAKDKSDSELIDNNGSNCEETNEKETRIQIFRYNPKTKKYKVLKKYENILENWSDGI